ncbi:MAG: 4Fe-4S binding protein [Candidatus Cloacimonetes bacterium]|nr:4Fe-4S binding protein [Candidatus Cloacimonadota bacterium]
MKEIVCISGKGGTGKSSVVAALSWIAKDNLVVADCDVDAADLHLIFSPHPRKSDDFFSGVKAVIDPAMCTACGLCADKCRFDAITKSDAGYRVLPGLRRLRVLLSSLPGGSNPFGRAECRPMLPK